MTKDEALKQALEALELHLTHHEHGCVYLDPAVTAIKEALAEPEITTGNILMDSYNAMQSMKVEGPRHVVCQCDKCKAQPEQEPVAWQVMVEDCAMKEFSTKDAADEWCVREKLSGSSYAYWIRPLYTTPPPCPTCEALARTVMLDQTGRDA